jgi:hypothetical protein
MDLKSIESAALHLPLKDSAKLVQRLLLSLDLLSESEIENAWLKEAQKRAQEIDGGDVQLVSAEEVRQKAQALFK